jgi:hypothetical protein
MQISCVIQPQDTKYPIVHTHSVTHTNTMSHTHTHSVTHTQCHTQTHSVTHKHTVSHTHSATHRNKESVHACVPSPIPSTMSCSEEQSTIMPSMPWITTWPLFLRKGAMVPLACIPEEDPKGFPAVERELAEELEVTVLDRDRDPETLFVLLPLPLLRLCNRLFITQGGLCWKWRCMR